LLDEAAVSATIAGALILLFSSSTSIAGNGTCQDKLKKGEFKD
jgi:hypothetical protein